MDPLPFMHHHSSCFPPDPDLAVKTHHSLYAGRNSRVSSVLLTRLVKSAHSRWGDCSFMSNQPENPWQTLSERLPAHRFLVECKAPLARPLP